MSVREGVRITSLYNDDFRVRPAWSLLVQSPQELPPLIWVWFERAGEERRGEENDTGQKR